MLNLDILYTTHPDQTTLRTPALQNKRAWRQARLTRLVQPGAPNSEQLESVDIRLLVARLQVRESRERSKKQRRRQPPTQILPRLRPLVEQMQHRAKSSPMMRRPSSGEQSVSDFPIVTFLFLKHLRRAAHCSFQNRFITFARIDHSLIFP